jgi:hypothetical protein
MRFLKNAFLVFVLGAWGCAHAADKQPPTDPASNPVMQALFDADQTDRQVRPFRPDIMAADQKRREQTASLLADGKLQTADDYYEAAFVFQHGDTSDDYLLAHILAMVAVAKGKQKALWISAATLDRYLQKIGQKQILGTQYRRDHGTPWTQEPYDRVLISDALRKTLGVITQAEQEIALKDMLEKK